MIESAENKLTFVVGSERVFPFPIAFYEPGNIDCYIRIDYVERKLADDEFKVEEKSDYSHGANITLLLDPLPTGATLAILRRIAIEQTLSLPFNGKLPSKSLEQSLDKLTMICQQQQEAIARSLTIGVTDAEYSTETLVKNIQQAAQEAAESAGVAAESAGVAANSAISAVDGAGLAQRYAAEVEAVISRSSGIPIGTVYPSLGMVPPEGAYLLDGQTIPNCREAHTQFWDWLTDGESGGIDVYGPWEMPALTRNGILGESDYAAVYPDYPDAIAYRAFDKNDGTWGNEIEDVRTLVCVFYSPVPVKLDHITLKYPSGAAPDFSLYGSMDNSHWEVLANKEPLGNPSINTFNVPENSGSYHYFRFILEKPYVSKIRMPETVLYGRQYLGRFTSGAKAALVTNEEYDAAISQYGICGGVVVDYDSGDVRLPTWKYQPGLPSTLPVNGNGIAVGLTNGTDVMGLEQNSNTVHAYTSLYGVAAGTVPSAKTGGANALALTSDPALSGIVVAVEKAAAVDTMYWCIQVYNTVVPTSSTNLAVLVSALQTKAQTDLANVNSNLDWVIETWRDGAGGWYRKYRSGWVEQGGRVSVKPDASVNVTVFVEFASTDYCANWIACDANSKSPNSAGSRVAIPQTTATIELYNGDDVNGNALWYAFGQGE